MVWKATGRNPIEKSIHFVALKGIQIIQEGLFLRKLNCKLKHKQTRIFSSYRLFPLSIFKLERSRHSENERFRLIQDINIATSNLVASWCEFSDFDWCEEHISSAQIQVPELLRARVVGLHEEDPVQTDPFYRWLDSWTTKRKRKIKFRHRITNRENKIEPSAARGGFQRKQEVLTTSR